MAITAADVKKLRESTGAGMMDAKKALTENDGDMDKAVDWLRTKGLAKAAKKSDRTAAEGHRGTRLWRPERRLARLEMVVTPARGCEPVFPTAGSRMPRSNGSVTAE